MGSVLFSITVNLLIFRNDKGLISKAREELDQRLNQAMMNRDKLKDDAIAHLSDQPTALTARLDSIEKRQLSATKSSTVAFVHVHKFQFHPSFIAIIESKCEFNYKRISRHTCGTVYRHSIFSLAWQRDVYISILLSNYINFTTIIILINLL